MVTVTISHTRLPAPGRKPTIYEVLKERLGREPTHRELCDDVRRIMDEGLQARAEAGKLAHQRRRYK
jgi:hypothetical protein